MVRRTNHPTRKEPPMATVRRRRYRRAPNNNGEEKFAWVADYFDQHKVRHQKTFPTKRTAQAWLVETQGEVFRGVHTPERLSITVFEAAQLWLERGAAEEIERATLRNYGTLVRLHIGPTIGAAKLATLSTPMLEGWRDRLVKRTSRTRARAVLSALKSILSEAQRRGLVAQNAAIPVRVDSKRRDRKKLEAGLDIPHKEQVQRLLGVPATHYPRHRPMLITAVFTGMRASELRGLPWSAVDFAKRTITVRQRADEWGTIGMPKSAAGQREIPMSPAVINTLREWKLACPKGEPRLGFPNHRGNRQ